MHIRKKGEESELEEVEMELTEQDQSTKTDNMEAGEIKEKSQYPKLSAILAKCFSPIFIQCFTMTFMAEWGDRSQIATIALASARDALGVTLGGIIGHAICTGGAVIGGKLLASRISERLVAAIGGVLFILFAIHSILFPDL